MPGRMSELLWTTVTPVSSHVQPCEGDVYDGFPVPAPSPRGERMRMT